MMEREFDSDALRSLDDLVKKGESLRASRGNSGGWRCGAESGFRSGDATLGLESLDVRSALQPGDLVGGRYLIVRKLGKGGMGEVYEACDEKEGDRVALKRMIGSKSRRAQERFQREYRILAAVSHENLVKGLDYLEAEGEMYIALEYAEGRPMSALLSSPEEFPLPERLAVANKVSRAVEVLNSAGVLHRDIKPENIIIGEESGLVKVVDLGLGKEWMKPEALTQVGVVLGTLPYLSPEQADGREAATSDMFSLGVTLYQWFLWEEKSPFHADSPIEVLRKVGFWDPPSVYERTCEKWNAQGRSPSHRERRAYRALSVLIELAMEKDSEKRLPDAGVIADQLACLYGEFWSMPDYRDSVANIKLTSLSAPLNLEETGVSKFCEEEGKRGAEIKGSGDLKGLRSRRRKLWASRVKPKPKARRRWTAAVVAAAAILILSLTWSAIFRERAIPNGEGNESDRAEAEEPWEACWEGEAEEPSESPRSFGPEGWPTGLWEACWDDEAGLVDFTREAWTSLSAQEQSKCAAAYQKWYAGMNGLETEMEWKGAGCALKMELVPPGRFWMGSPQGEAGRDVYRPYVSVEIDVEQRHRVEMARAFYMSRCEVTRAQWTSVMEMDPSHFREGGPDVPVERVSWERCAEFCRKAGGNLRLPTEAEWEYACRAGTTYMSPVGDFEPLSESNAPALDAIAWYSGNSGVDYGGAIDSSRWPDMQHPHAQSGTHPAGTKMPNAWGLHDMLGNVMEWCRDYWAPDYYSNSEEKNPEGPPSGREKIRRGTGFTYGAVYCRSAFRACNTPENVAYYVGFRPMLEISR